MTGSDARNGRLARVKRFERSYAGTSRSAGGLGFVIMAGRGGRQGGRQLSTVHRKFGIVIVRSLLAHLDPGSIVVDLSVSRLGLLSFLIRHP